MKVNKIIGHWDNAAYEMNLNIRIKEEALAPTEEIMKLSFLLGKADTIPLPVVMVVIHDLLVDIANKTGQDFDTILKLISDTNMECPADLMGRKVKYELR